MQREFQSQYRTQAHQGNNSYLKKLFDGRLYLQCLPNFKNEHFANSVKGVVEIFVNPKKQLNRKVKDVLKSLKLRLAELSHDDSNIDRNNDEYDLGEARNEVLLAWFYGK